MLNPIFQRTGALTVIIFSAFIMSFFDISKPEASDFLIPLNGIHKFSPGDDPAWALPHYDDSQWKGIHVPGNYQSQGIKTENGMGWYRIHFTATEKIKDTHPAVAFGRIGNADEVFLNGFKIGGEGKIGRWFIEATKADRLYRIPPGILRFDRDNVLAVRVMNVFLAGGIFDGAAGIGDYNALRIEKLNGDFLRKAREIGLFVFYSLFFMASLFFYVSGTRDKEYIYFGLFALISVAVAILESLILYEAGLKTSLIQQIIAAIYGILPVSLMLFIMSVFRERTGLFLKLLVIFSLVLSVSLLFSTYNFRVFKSLSLMWVLQLLLTGSFGLYIVVRAYMRKLNESRPIMTGTAALFLSVLLESMYNSDIIHTGGLTVSSYLVSFFMICMMYALIRRFLRIKKETASLSSRILTAHEEERKRLARELHDGLGQSLLAVKFNLQRMNKETKSSLLEGAIEEISGSIDDLRDISMGLRPPFLDEMGIGAAVRLYSQKFTEKNGINVDVKTELSVRPTSLIEDNLFRILQEAFSNTVKHAEAENIKVYLGIRDGRIIMEIDDDGRGFDYGRISQNSGLGLSTMEERINLMGGVFSLRSKSGAGTTIRVEVPVIW